MLTFFWIQIFFSFLGQVSIAPSLQDDEGNFETLVEMSTKVEICDEESGSQADKTPVLTQASSFQDEDDGSEKPEDIPPPTPDSVDSALDEDEEKDNIVYSEIEIGPLSGRKWVFYFDFLWEETALNTLPVRPQKGLDSKYQR